MKLIPDKSVDLVVTDPPYKIVAGGGGGCFGTEKREYHKGVKGLSYGFENIILDECMRILKIFNLYIFCSKDQILQILQWAKENNLNIDILCYHKLNPIPTVNNKYLSDTEYIIFLREQGACLKGNYESKKKYFLQNNSKTNLDHPTVKPLNIITTLVLNSTQDNDLVLDPFMGSWTTARACKDIGRNFIGFELSEEYCAIGEKRLRQEVLF
jgi:site-specific DNA-methyltransferase (adenine-specific)